MSRARLPLILVVALAIAAVVVVSAAPAFADSSGRGHAKAREGAHPSCHGLANAYAHGGAVAEVAAKHGCDLTGITPAKHPEEGDADKDKDEHPEDANGDEDSGPPAEVVAAKCERIAGKLEAAEAREHGNSAAAFARQADHWSCSN